MLQIDYYDINKQKVIGRGQFGTVYECKSLKPGEEKLNLCAKIMEVQNDKFAERETKILTIIKNQYKCNDNIVQVHYVKYDQPRKNMVVIMERCQTNLEDVWKNKLKKKENFTCLEIRNFLEQVLVGYLPLYNNCIVHRDLKPENIMMNFLNQTPTFKLADFGVGKNMNDEKSNATMQTQTGTPVYAPPEINFLVDDETLIQDLKVCQELNSVDIYSIGMIMWQMMFGDFPFCQNYLKNPTLVDIVEFFKVLKGGRFPVVDEQMADKELLQLIKRMIVYYPSKRITFKELYQQFKIDLPLKEKQGSDSSSGSTNYSDSSFQQAYPYSNYPQFFKPQQQPTFNTQPNQQINNPGQQQSRIQTKPEAKSKIIPNNFQQANQQANFQQGNQQANFQQANFQQGNQQPNFYQGNQQPNFQQANFQQGNQQPNFQQQNFQQQNFQQQNFQQQQQQNTFPQNQNNRVPTKPSEIKFSVRVNTNNVSKEVLLQIKEEITDYLNFLLDNKESLQQEKILLYERYVKELDELTPEKVSSFTLQQKFKELKQQFVYYPKKKYSSNQIRLLYLLGLVFDNCITASSLQIQPIQMEQKLEEWAYRNQQFKQ